MVGPIGISGLAAYIRLSKAGGREAVLWAAGCVGSPILLAALLKTDSLKLAAISVLSPSYSSWSL